MLLGEIQTHLSLLNEESLMLVLGLVQRLTAVPDNLSPPRTAPIIVKLRTVPIRGDVA